MTNQTELTPTAQIYRAVAWANNDAPMSSPVTECQTCIDYLENIAERPQTEEEQNAMAQHVRWSHSREIAGQPPLSKGEPCPECGHPYSFEPPSPMDPAEICRTCSRPSRQPA